MTDEKESELPEAEELTEVKHRDWSGLSSELLTLILSYLFLDDISRFRDVCTTWQSVPIPSVPSPIKFPVVQSQWLMCIGKYCTGFKFFHPVCNDTYHMEVPELFGAVLRFSKDGWLLMSLGERSIFFFNPFTKAKINLPDIPNNYEFDGISFSSVPTSSDCAVFGFYGFFEECVFISTIRRGEETWRVYRFNNNVHFVSSPCNPVIYNGMLYCLSRDGSLGVFDPKENGRWTVFADPQQPSAHQNFLMECDGKLISVFVGFMGTWISIFQLDNLKMTWQKLDNLGDKMLFVSDTTSLSARKVVHEMENKIYFPRFHGKYGVFYNIATRMFETFGKDYSRKDFYDTRELLHCSWIEPKIVLHSEEELNWPTNL